MDQRTTEFISDASRLADLAKTDPDQDSSHVLLFHAQMRMVIRDWIRGSSPEQIEELRNSSADQIWAAVKKL